MARLKCGVIVGKFMTHLEKKKKTLYYVHTQVLSIDDNVLQGSYHIQNSFYINGR